MEIPGDPLYTPMMTSDFITASAGQKLGEEETAEERAERISRETEIIALGRSQLAAGQGIPLEALKTWLRQRRTAPDTPLPLPGGSVSSNR